MDLLKPGRYDFLSNSSYHADPALSHSMMEKLRKSPAHLKAYLDEKPEPTAAMIFGSAFHAAVLQPDIYDRNYEVLEEGKRRSSKSDNVQITFKDGEKIEAMRRAILSNAKAKALLGDGFSEVSFAWRVKPHGFIAKCRPDHFRDDIAIDLKTTKDASPEAFSKALVNYGYFRQAAHYIDGLKANGIKINHFIFVCIEKEAPYAVSLFRLSDDDIYLGQLENKLIYEQYDQCLRMDYWPCYPEEIQEIKLPQWYIKNAKI